MLLKYRTYGQGEPVLILHGLLGSMDNWHPVAKILSKDFFVITPDLRNHGRSPHSPVFDYPAMQQDILHLLETLKIDKINLTGHSMGGKLAMHIALNNPDIVDKLIIIDSGVGKYEGIPEIFTFVPEKLKPEDFTSRVDFIKALNKLGIDSKIKQLLLKNIKRNKNSGTLEWKFNLEAIKNNYDKIIAPVTAENTFDKECLFIRGEKSGFIDVAEEKNIKKLFPKAKIITIKDAGHWVHVDNAPALIYAIYGFLATNA